MSGDEAASLVMDPESAAYSERVRSCWSTILEALERALTQ